MSDIVSKHIVHVFFGTRWHEGLHREHPDALVAYCHGLGRWRWWVRGGRIGEDATLSGAREAAMASLLEGPDHG